MIRFLQHYDLGHGDYSKERHEWVDNMTPEQIMEGIQQLRQEAQGRETEDKAA